MTYTSGTGSAVHPAAMAIDRMLMAYGGQWPPRPQFTDWPQSWRAFQEIADAMTTVCHDLNDAAKFREWMEAELEEKIDLKNVMEDTESRMRTDDPVFLSFLAPLSYMVNLYRWGTIPPTDEERMRTQLNFPEQLWTPFAKLNNFWGLVHRGNTFSLNVCNCLYENEAEPDIPTDMRFCFNFRPDIIKSEKNFFKSFLHMENTFRPALFAIHEYLEQTEIARESREDAERVLARRIELLGCVRKVIVKVARIFSLYMKDHMVSVKDWADYVQALPAWNINGIDGGASGGESLTFHALDEFLGTDGQGVIYMGGMRKRQGIPTQYIDILNALREFGREDRFCSFLGHAERDDPVLKAKDDVIQMLYTWRLGHAKVAPRYLRPSRMTSGGSVDKVIITGETLATRGEFELRERARETAWYLKTRDPPTSVHLGKATEATVKATETPSYVMKLYDLVAETVANLWSKLSLW